MLYAAARQWRRMLWRSLLPNRGIVVTSSKLGVRRIPPIVITCVVMVISSVAALGIVGVAFGGFDPPVAVGWMAWSIVVAITLATYYFVWRIQRPRSNPWRAKI